MAKVKDSVFKQATPCYRDCLDTMERTRYSSKLKLIDENDPYELKSWSSDVHLLPKISYPDIVNYLVFSPSPYTLDDLKSYKGLEAYNQFISGWVRELSTVVINKRHIVMAKVLHSQRLKEKPLILWVISDADGKVIGAHCNCMAGLGESCTHISALLFTIEGTVKVRDSKTVTQEPTYWMLPSAGKVYYNETRNINFASAKSQKRKFDNTLASPNSCHVNKNNFSTKTTSTISDPTAEEMSVFYQPLYKTGVKCAVLSLIPSYADDYVPKFMSNKYPMVLTELRNENTFNLNYMELLDECSKVDISVNQNEADAVQLATLDQANSKQWFSFRSGRITASRMIAVCA
ncbi:uncharacterized protein LOC132564294 [Ylistrum balloti]|uniref:uncharacterized protein LOC132564294 n=1 Tax=Ylistrum balloti TaxID=509963 RepID=UPI002905A6BE|nr:uncharacterized protein LOC132564294 [Ylistrum balloti]